MSILLTILSYAGIILLVVVIFNILIIVHELGHFLAAIWRGLVVEKFAIWFGKPLWKKEINGVEYILGTIPAGGYVALPQLAPMEALEGESKLDKKTMKEASPLDKIIVAFAGPLFSFGLALVFAVIVWMVGKPVTDMHTNLYAGHVREMVEITDKEEADKLRSAENPVPMKENLTYKEGLRTGDKILEVDGYEVDKRVGMGDSIMWRFIRAESEQVPVVVERDGQRMELALTPITQDKEFYQRGALRMPPIPPVVPPMVGQAEEGGITDGQVYPGSPADKAGLQAYDLITAINGIPVKYHTEVTEFVRSHPGETALYTIQRRFADANGNHVFYEVEKDGRNKRVYPTIEFTIPITPEKPVEFVNDYPPYMLGIGFAVDPEIDLTYPNPIEQVGDSVMAVVNTVDALFAPSSVNASHLSGPVGIMNLYARMLSNDIWFSGWRYVMWISVVINVNLAIINLLPLPVLDGGHIMFALIEWIRRKPVSVKVLEVLNGATALLLIGFILYVTYYDAQDVFSGGGGAEEARIRFASEAPAEPGAKP